MIRAGMLTLTLSMMALVLAIAASAQVAPPPCPYMHVLAPSSVQSVTANQVTNPSPANVAVQTTAEHIPAAPFKIKVQAAKDIKNIVVFTHGNMLAQLAPPDATHTNFTGTVDFTNETNGPLTIGFFAYDTAPPSTTFSIELIQYMTVIITGGKDDPYSVAATAPLPVGAAGMTLAWSDEFNTLSATPCKPGTGTWPACTHPTAADGFTWFENKANGGDYGGAAFEHTDGPFNPYTVDNSSPTNGMLRIRSTYNPSYVDPYGFKRLWYTGFLSSAFLDATTNVPLADGYYEIRELIPFGNAGNPISGGANGLKAGGTWPTMFQMTIPYGPPALEIDNEEQYGNDVGYLQQFTHCYGTATGCHKIFAGHPGPVMPWDFHRIGILVTPTAWTSYLDDVLLGTTTPGTLPGVATPAWFLMIGLPMGGGWPINPPPADYFDMWIDYVRYYH